MNYFRGDKNRIIYDWIKEQIMKTLDELVADKILDLVHYVLSNKEEFFEILWKNECKARKCINVWK